MSEVCNSCGNFEGLEPCQYCSCPLCKRCKFHHESTCAQIKKKKSLGLGPTVRQTGVPEAPVTEAPVVIEPPATPPDALDILLAEANEILNPPATTPQMVFYPPLGVAYDASDPLFKADPVAFFNKLERAVLGSSATTALASPVPVIDFGITDFE